MFSQSLDASAESGWRKAGAMLLSLGLHLFAMAVVVIISLLYVEYIVVGEGDLTGTTLAFSAYPRDPRSPESQPEGGPPRVQVVSARSRSISKIKGLLFEPTPLPPDLAVVGPVPLIYEPGPDRWPSGPCGCVAPYREVDPRPSPMKPPPVDFATQSHFTKGILVKRVDPQYPPSARQAGIHGAVVIHAVIDREGMVHDIDVLSGPQQLRAAAVEAVRQWRYKPYELDGLSIDVETTITVRFELNRKT